MDVINVCINNKVLGLNPNSFQECKKLLDNSVVHYLTYRGNQYKFLCDLCPRKTLRIAVPETSCQEQDCRTLLEILNENP